MKQFENFDDDNIEQIGEDSFVVNYDGYYVSHCDTTINNQHVIIDTIYKHDTIIVEKTMFQDEIRVIEKLIDRPDFGKSAVSILILVFVIYTIWKKWDCKKQNNG